MVVGRHSRAHVRLAGDPTIGLRHLVLRSRHDAEGRPFLAVSDLLAQRPFFVDGADTPQRACAARGAITLRVGAHALTALPFDGCAPLDARGGPGRADREEPPLDDDDASPTDAEVEAPVDRRLVNLAAWRAASRAPSDVHVTTRTGSTHLGLVALPSQAAPGLRLVLRGARGRTSLVVPSTDLDGLVIVGRYERCAAGPGVFAERVSRMHLALTRCAEGIEVLDLASTNGLRIDEVETHRAVLRRGHEITFSDDGDEWIRVHALP